MIYLHTPSALVPSDPNLLYAIMSNLVLGASISLSGSSKMIHLGMLTFMSLWNGIGQSALPLDVSISFHSYIEVDAHQYHVSNCHAVEV